MFYFNWEIDIVDLIINLIIVVITTATTYFLFSVLPTKRRKKFLKKRLQSFREELVNNILNLEEDFKNTYNRDLIEDSKHSSKENRFEIINSASFLSNFRYILLSELTFRDYWLGNELIILINNLVMDDKYYIDLSIKLSRFRAELNHASTLLGDKSEYLWKIKSIDEIIKKDIDYELIGLTVSTIEDIFDLSKELEELISKIIGKRQLKRKK